MNFSNHQKLFLHSVSGFMFYRFYLLPFFRSLHSFTVRTVTLENVFYFTSFFSFDSIELHLRRRRKKKKRIFFFRLFSWWWCDDHRCCGQRLWCSRGDNMLQQRLKICLVFKLTSLSSFFDPFDLKSCWVAKNAVQKCQHFT